MVAARGPLSQALLAALRDDAPADALPLVPPADGDVLADDDQQLSLWLLYELHHGGLDAVADDREWDPDLLRFRARLEQRLERALRDRAAGAVDRWLSASGDVAQRIFAQAEAHEGSSLSRYVPRRATADQLREVFVHRSLYQLKEADPHTFVAPRVGGAVKAALVELQYDEYGAGRPERQHARLFARGLAECGLDDRPGGYVDAVPACTLALNNAMSLLCLHRRLRGAALGHLAAIEVTSSLPSRRMVQGLRRLELSPAMVDYFDEHVEADAVHEQVATRDICAALVDAEPDLLPDVFLGVEVALLTESLLAEHVLDRFERGLTSLRTEATAEAVA